MVTCLKHYPGDGWEERDQHIVIGNNGLSCEEWDNSYGKVYSHFINDGLLSIMVGHFTMPAYQRKLNPNLQDKDIMPACLSPELINGLLRGQLGFNGLVLTDQTRMLGYYAMKRKDAIVQSIASGIDIVLGINDIEEDVENMKRGIEDGRITPERLQDAIYRILATKAAIGLHKKQKDGTIVPSPEALSVVGCEKFKKWAVEASDSSITLVKDTKNILPLRPETHKHLLINFLGSAFTTNLLGQGVATGGSAGVKENIIKAFEDAGFEVTVYEEVPGLRTKGKISEFEEKYDAALIFADFSGFATTNSIRVNWGSPMSNGAPWYEPEIPTIFVSLNYTNHMIDVPRIPVFINAYNDQPYTIELLVKKLMGESQFRGKYNENVWCGCWDTHF
jgi:beta-N-acetylhexosaminidase